MASLCTFLCFSAGYASDCSNEETNTEDQEKIYCDKETIAVTEEGIQVYIAESAQNAENTVVTTTAIHTDEEGLYVLEGEIIAKCPCSSNKDNKKL